MSVVVGCDIVELSEIAESLNTFRDRYIRKIFTDAEAAYCVGPDRVARFAARFAAKEALIKALQITDEPTPFTEIEIIRDREIPTLRLHGSIAHIAAESGVDNWSLSLSHADCHAMAVVIGTKFSDPGTQNEQRSAVKEIL